MTLIAALLFARTLLDSADGDEIAAAFCCPVF